MILTATTVSLRHGVIGFIQSLEGEEEGHTKERVAEEINLEVVSRLVFTYMCTVCKWFLCMIVHNKSTIQSTANAALLLCIETHIVKDVVVVLQQMLTAFNIQDPEHVVRTSFAELKLEVANCLHMLRESDDGSGAATVVENQVDEEDDELENSGEWL